MLSIPESGWIYRIMGIDNGSNTVGVVIIDHDLRTGVSTVIYAETLTADKTAYWRYPGRAEARDKMYARLAVIEDFIAEVLEEYDPDIVGCESPFSHLHVGSYTVLVHSMRSIDDAVYRYSTTLEFAKVPPGRAKKSVCPPKQYKNDKELIRGFILADPTIVAGPDVVLSSLDEHCIDGISVARYLALDAKRAFS